MVFTSKCTLQNDLQAFQIKHRWRPYFDTANQIQHKAAMSQFLRSHGSTQDQQHAIALLLNSASYLTHKHGHASCPALQLVERATK